MANLMEKVSDFADMPKDITMGWAKLTFVGHRNLQVDNYRGLLSYSQENIRLAAKTADILVTGKGLAITRIEAETVFVEGDIENVEFIHKTKQQGKKNKKALAE